MRPPQDPTRPPDAAQGSRELRASQRIAVGTLARSVGEVVAKVASLVFAVAIARELGQEQFGDFIFGLSLSSVLFIGAGLGLNELLSREIARDPGRVDDLFWNIIAIRWLTLIGLSAIVGIVAVLNGYAAETAAAIVVISVGVGLDFQSNTLFAVFQGLERNQHIATSLIVNRISTAVMVIAVLAAGGGILAAAAVFSLGSGLGIATAYLLMRRYVVRPRREIEPHGWPALTRLGLPLAFVGPLNQSMLRLSVVMLGFLASSAETGDYGAASRLIEATMFIPWAFGGAILPWFSRHTGEGIVSLARGYEMAGLAARYPHARVLGVEPDPENAALARRNVEAFGPRCRVVQTAIWDSATELTIVGDWVSGYRVRPSRREDPVHRRLQGTTVGQLLDEHMPDGDIDYVVMNLERTEPRVLASRCGLGSAGGIDSLRDLSGEGARRGRGGADAGGPRIRRLVGAESVPWLGVRDQALTDYLHRDHDGAVGGGRD